MTAIIGSDTIQRSARAGRMVTGIFITLATWNNCCRWSAMYNTVPIIPALCRISSDYSRIMPAPWTCLLCPKLCRHNSRIPSLSSVAANFWMIWAKFLKLLHNYVNAAFSLFLLYTVSSQVLAFYLGSYTQRALPGLCPLAGQRYCGWQHYAWGSAHLPVVIDCIRNFGGVGGQANIARHKTLITRNRHNQSGRELDAAVCIKCSLCLAV